jgi:hypothetical protein
LGSSVVGADTAASVVKDKSGTAKINLHGPSSVGSSGIVPKSGSYFKNPEGGFGQYYKGALRELGVVVEHSSDAWPDVRLSNYAGRRIAQAIDKNKSFTELKELALQGSGRLSELSQIGKKVHPLAIESESEEAILLRSLFFGQDESLCHGQDAERKRWRCQSLSLMLHFIREAELIEGDLAQHFRWGCAYRLLPNGRAWNVPATLRDTARGWAAYQRNDLLNFCLECIFYAALTELDQGPCRLGEMISRLAELALAAVPSHGDQPRLAPVPKTVSQWVAAMKPWKSVPDAEHWGSSTTWSIADRLESSIAGNKAEIIMPLAARLLGRLATDRGDHEGHPFSPITDCVKMAASNEVHLHNWWKRSAAHSSQRTLEFFRELLLEWILYRHLRVATRKLANQGVSTFKFRPGEGQLFLVAERLPKPTYTSPRVRQAFRVLEDLHCIDHEDGRASLSPIGGRILGGKNA